MSEEKIIMNLHQILHLSVQRGMKSLEKFNLNMGQGSILLVIGKEGQLSQRELAERMGFSPPSVTVAIQKMEKKGLIIREQDENDQRIMRLRLTEKGEENLKDVKGILKKSEEIAVKGMNTEEILLLHRLLLQMKDNLKEVGGVEHRHHHRGCSKW